MALTPGTNLDGFEILGLLGAGGMGEVYRARDSLLNREVAIKVLPSFVSQDSERLRRFEHEAQATAALNHPNIVAVYRFGTFQQSHEQRPRPFRCLRNARLPIVRVTHKLACLLEFFQRNLPLPATSPMVCTERMSKFASQP